MVAAFWIIMTAFGLGLSGAWATTRYASKLQLIDVPSKRSSHTRPTPKGGGAGILAAFVLFAIVSNLPISVIGAACSLSLVSFRSDRQDLPPHFRLLIQFACATIAMWGIGFNEELSLHAFWRAILFPPVLVFIVGTANFYNFMDGINGIAGITGLIAFGGLTALAISQNRGEVAGASLALAASCGGFLPLNIPRAKVFMGDIGSVLLGFCFAIFTVALSRSFVEFLTICTLLFPFYADELCTMAQRFKQGDALFLPHRKHLYQVLVNERGIAHWKVSVGYGLIQMASFGIICFLSRFGLPLVLLGLCALMICWFAFDYRVKSNIL
jgi:Fuc2NAc and GlcNAc transferase